MADDILNNSESNDIENTLFNGKSESLNKDSIEDNAFRESVMEDVEKVQHGESSSYQEFAQNANQTNSLVPDTGENERIFRGSSNVLNNIAGAINSGRALPDNINPIGAGTPPEMIEALERQYQMEQNQQPQSKLQIEQKTQTVQQETFEKEKRDFAKSDPNAQLNIKTVEEKRIRVVETNDSIKTYEENLEKTEREKYERLQKEEDDKLNKLVEDLQSELVEEIIEDSASNINLKTTSEEDKSKDESNIEVIENSFDKEENKDEIEYLGGDPKKINELPFISKSNKWGQSFVNLKEVPSNIESKELILANEDQYAEYIIQKARFTNSFTTKVALPYSGMTVYIQSYTNGTLFNLLNAYNRWRAQQSYARERDDDSKDSILLRSESYLKLRELEIDSIYQHITRIYVVGKGVIEKPDKETFLKMVKYPDLKALYFAAYHGTNKNKRKTYTITCKKDLVNKETGMQYKCNHQNEREFYDEELVFSIGNKKLSKEDFYMLIRDGYPKDRTLKITEDSNMEIERYTETKSTIIQSVPNLQDYLETLNLLYEYMSSPDDTISSSFNYDLSLIDTDIDPDNWNSSYYDIPKLLKTYLYTKQMEVLWVDNNKTGDTSKRIISASKGFQQRKLIFDNLLALDLPDMYSLTKGEKIKEMMTLKAIEYYIPAIDCEACQSHINPIPFDVRLNFFILLSMARAQTR